VARYTARALSGRLSDPTRFPFHLTTLPERCCAAFSDSTIYRRLLRVPSWRRHHVDGGVIDSQSPWSSNRKAPSTSPCRRHRFAVEARRLFLELSLFPIRQVANETSTPKTGFRGAELLLTYDAMAGFHVWISPSSAQPGDPRNRPELPSIRLQLSYCNGRIFIVDSATAVAGYDLCVNVPPRSSPTGKRTVLAGFNVT